VAATVAVLGTATVLGTQAPAGAAPGPGNGPEYWFDNWNVPQLWQSGARGQGITIAEIDTGVNASLPELANNVLSGTDFGQAGNGQVDREVSEFGHGTAMASIMVAHPGTLNITGIAPDAKVLPIAVPLTGTTDAGGDDHLAPAIRWAADHGAKVISMSLGGVRTATTDSLPCPDQEQAAVYYAMQKGAILLASSGNSGLSGSPVEEPGVCLGVISVGAVDSNNVAADFSAKHPYLTLTAPGVNIPSLSRVAGTAYAGDGTSQATAVASAVMAIVWSRYPKLSSRQVVARVLATLDRHSSTRDPSYGYGIINAQRAVTAAVPLDAPNPVYSFTDPFTARLNAFASAATLPVPPPAPTGTKQGTPSVVSSPRLFVPRVIEGASVGAAGLLALLGLLILGLLRRRHRRRPVVARLPEPGQPALTPATTTDPAGLVWHQIIDPQGEHDSFR
jgi:subtilisin family serine protease